MKDWLKCQISPLVKYRQNQNQKQKLYALMKRAPQNWTPFMSNQANLQSWSSNKKRSVFCKDDV